MTAQVSQDTGGSGLPLLLLLPLNGLWQLPWHGHGPTGVRCTEPPHSPGGQSGLSARRWARGDGSSSELPAELLLQETGIATSWGAASGTSSGRTGRDQHPKTGRGEEGAGAQPRGAAEATHDCRCQL